MKTKFLNLPKARRVKQNNRTAQLIGITSQFIHNFHKLQTENMRVY